MPTFNIIIVGAGIAGLSAAIALRRKGHSVTVLERHSACQALGGPVGISPCATRVLIEYGLGDILGARTLKSSPTMNFRRYDTGTVLASADRSKNEEAYGFPAWNMSRSRLQEVLADVAIERGVVIKFSSQVVSINQGRTAVVLKDGAEMEADLIIGADGIRSITRDEILGAKTKSTTHFTAYNIDIPRSLMEKDADLAELLYQINFWVGPKQIIVAINVPDHNDRYNICLTTEEQDGRQGEWYILGDLDGVKAKFAHFDPRIRKLLDLADPGDCYIWRLSEVSPLPGWHGKGSRVVLAGDSAHAMLPYSGMGASSCIEDAACLAECIGRAESIDDISSALSAYEQIRKTRAEWFVARGRHVAGLWHLSDGEEQQKRDHAWATKPLSLPDMTVWDGKHIDDPPTGPEVLFDPLINPWISAHDIIGYTKRRLDQIWPTS